MDKDLLTQRCDRAQWLINQLPDDHAYKPRLNNMVKVLREHEDFPDAKTFEWLGHINGACIISGISSDNDERDFSRPIKHEHFRRNNIPIPDTVDVMKD
jgi:hypothetical protein